MSNINSNLPPRPLPPRPGFPPKKVEGDSLSKDKQDLNQKSNTELENNQVDNQVLQNDIELEQTNQLPADDIVEGLQKNEPVENNDVQVGELTTESNKLEKNKKSKRKFNKKLLFVLLGLVLVLIIGGSVGTYFIVTSLDTNQKLEIGNSKVVVYEYSDKVYIKAPELQCNKYVFQIQSNTNKSVVHSFSSLLDVTDFLEVGKTYTMKFHIQGESEKSKSDVSVATTFTYTKKLATPNARLSQDGQSIVWEKVPNATSYNVYYYNPSNQSVASVEVTSTDDLVEFIPQLPIGSYGFQVIAKSTKQGYLESTASNSIDFVKKQQELAPKQILVDRDNAKIDIQIDMPTVMPVFVIRIGEKVYKYQTSELSENYTISLKTFTQTIELGKTVSVYVEGRNEFYISSNICTE